MDSIIANWHFGEYRYHVKTSNQANDHKAIPRSWK